MITPFAWAQVKLSSPAGMLPGAWYPVVDLDGNTATVLVDGVGRRLNSHFLLLDDGPPTAAVRSPRTDAATGQIALIPVCPMGHHLAAVASGATRCRCTACDRDYDILPDSDHGMSCR